MLPFSREAFFGVFAAYNTAVWPAHVALYGLAGFLVWTAMRRTRHARRWMAIGLAVLWLWTGTAYHWWHFTAVNRLAWAFGALFMLQGVLLLAHGLTGRGLAMAEPDARHGWRGWAGGLLLVYALILYPLAGLAGHPPDQVPWLGTPCPTTIFTFGLLFWTVPPLPRHLLAVPLLWAAVGGTAAFLLGVPQDLGLLAAGILGLTLLRRSSAGSRSGPAGIVEQVGSGDHPTPFEGGDHG